MFFVFLVVKMISHGQKQTLTSRLITVYVDSADSRTKGAAAVPSLFEGDGVEDSRFLLFISRS